MPGPIPRPPRVGILDLDIFGPSTPKLMGLETADEPRLTEGKPFHLLPLFPNLNKITFHDTVYPLKAEPSFH